MPLPAIFNPSNDMALAANLRQYFPPRHIQQMEDDLATLSRFWDSGPWGWSLATRQRYLRMGIAADHLPSDEWLAELRRLSSRQFGVEYYTKMSRTKWNGEIIPCQARFCTSLDEVKSSIFRSAQRDACVAQRSKNLQSSIFNLQSSILKSPWSSSGRGNILVPNGQPDNATLRRIESIIRQQGGIVVEPFYADKILDFAMEFDVSDEGTRFLGYSVFDADETGHYGGNYVESQEALRQRIGLPDDLLQGFIDYHTSVLARLPYRGPVGIDMMRLGDGCVHPCVEINFRMTMGLLALLLYNKGITADQLLAGNPQHGFSAVIRQGSLIIRYIHREA